MKPKTKPVEETIDLKSRAWKLLEEMKPEGKIFWEDWEVDVLRKAVAKGLSSKQIGVLLTNKTHSAIRNKIHIIKNG